MQLHRGAAFLSGSGETLPAQQKANTTDDSVFRKKVKFYVLLENKPEGFLIPQLIDTETPQNMDSVVFF